MTTSRLSRHLPFLLVPFFALAVAFTAWMSLSAAGVPETLVLKLCAAIFLLVGIGAGSYFLHIHHRYPTHGHGHSH